MTSIRSYINVIESSSLEVTPDVLVGVVKSMHHTPQDFYFGDLVDRIQKCKRYVLRELPISSITHAEWYVDDVLVASYVDKLSAGDEYPLIIYDAVDGSIIDGTHRVNALLSAGVDVVRAYVGLPENLDPDWDEGGEEEH